MGGGGGDGGIEKYIVIVHTPCTRKLSCEFESRSGDVYSIQHYVMKSVCDLRQVSGFLWVFRFLPPIKLTATI